MGLSIRWYSVDTIARVEEWRAAMLKDEACRKYFESVEIIVPPYVVKPGRNEPVALEVLSTMRPDQPHRMISEDRWREAMDAYDAFNSRWAKTHIIPDAVFTTLTHAN